VVNPVASQEIQRVRQQLLDLNEIQKLDIEIRDIARAKDGVPEALQGLEARIQQTRSELEALVQEHETVGTEVRSIEGTIHIENDKIRKWERRLNDIRNQREYQALSREIEGTRRAVRDHEEQVIELMARKEELEAQMERLHNKIAEDEVDRETERARVEAEVAKIDLTLDEYQKRRDQLGPKIKPNLLRRYEGIRAKRLGVGLVPADGGSCTGCNMRLPPQLFNILQRVDSIEICPSCQRILIFQGALDEATGGSQTPGAEAQASSA
jgi:predicted  nucleic acid-binding Zn-ribbon protein